MRGAHSLPWAAPTFTFANRALPRCAQPATHQAAHACRSVAEAAQATGVNRSTILRAMKSGRISGQRDATRAWSVEAVELHRVFPPAEATPRAVPQDAQTWQGIAERLALGAPKPEPAPVPKPRPWSWRWLRST